MTRLFAALAVLVVQTNLAHARTIVSIQGRRFTLNGQVTYTPASGVGAADPSIAGTLLNLRAVQGIFDDSNYPNEGSAQHPYNSPGVGPISFDYPDSGFSSGRNLKEFLAALPTWRRCGLLAFTVNLQGGGPTDGNFAKHLQPHLNSGFDARGNLKPAYAARLGRVIDEADKLGMVVIVGFFYQGSEQRVDLAPGDAYVKEAVRQAAAFLKDLPNRNVLIEIANEVSPTMYTHPSLQADGIVELVKIAQNTVERQIPVSFSWVGDPPKAGSDASVALAAVDYLMFHTNRQSPEGVQNRIAAYRKAAGVPRPLLINEDGVSVFNLQAATQEHVGWGYYDQGLNNYKDGFQSPPVNWAIDTLAKWLFFEQVARLTGSPLPPRPAVLEERVPLLTLSGLQAGATLKRGSLVQVVSSDTDGLARISRVEFFVDGKPYSYALASPFRLGNSDNWDMHGIEGGRHVLRIVTYERGGPAFTEICSMQEISFNVKN
jgi:hypothetical protein